MKKFTLFLVAFGFVLTTNISFAQQTGYKSFKIKTNSENGFQYSMLEYTCDSSFSTDLTKVSEKEKEIFINIKTDNIAFSVFNSEKTIQIGFPIFLNNSDCQIYIPIADTTLTLIQICEQIKIDGSKNTVDFYNIFRSQQVSDLKQEKSLANFELLNRLFTENPNNYFAASILAQTVKDSSWLLNLIRTTDCVSLKNILQGIKIQNENSKKVFTELPYKKFFDDLTVQTVSIDKSIVPNFAKLKGTGTIIFWASWCAPCVQGISAMSDEEKNNPNTFFISLDRNKEQCIKRADALGLKKNVFMVTDNKWLGNYGINSIPVHLIYDANKKTCKKEK